MRDVIDDIKEAFLTGVSYMLPFVVAGGILVALGFLLGGYNIPSVEPLWFHIRIHNLLDW